MSTLRILAVALLTMQSAPAPQEQASRKEEPKLKTYFEYRNTADGITLRMVDGRVELTVPVDKAKGGHGEFTTCKSSSLEEFKRLYPDLARKYDLDQYLPRTMTPQAVEKRWEEWCRQLGWAGEDWFSRRFNDSPGALPEAIGRMDRWFDEEHRRLRDLERRFHDESVPPLAGSSGSRALPFGIRVAPMSEALRAQLGVKSGEGLVVAEIEKGSIAESSEVKRFDVLLKIAGREIKDAATLRDQAAAALQSKEFELDLIRGGHPMKLAVHPSHS